MDSYTANYNQTLNFANKPYQKNSNRKNSQNYTRPQNPSRPYKTNPSATLPSNGRNTQYKPQNQGPNAWKPQIKDQSYPTQNRAQNFGKNNESYNGQQYWESMNIGTINYRPSDQSLTDLTVLGFKVVHDGHVVHDEMCNNNGFACQEQSPSFGGLNGPRFNEMPVSAEISLPSFIEI